MNKFKVFLIIFIVLAAGAALFLVYKFFPQKQVLPVKKLNETVQTPLPQTNPFEEAKTNPFKDIRTNPFE